MRRPGRRAAPVFSVAEPLLPAQPQHREATPLAPVGRHIARGAGFSLALALCLTAVLFVSQITAYPAWQAGHVATTTMFAPHDFTFRDDARTALLQQRAASMVPAQYRVDSSAQQGAVALATTLLSTATGLRGAAPAGQSDPRIAALVRVSNGLLSPALAAELLGLSVQDLARVRSVLLAALAAAGKQAVYPSQLSAMEAAPPFPTTLPLGTVRTVAGALFSLFLRPNRVPDAALMARARQQAIDRVPPVQIPYRRGQVIVRSGDVLDATTLAVLRAAGLTGSNASWESLFADLLICVVVAGFLHGYLVCIRSPILVHVRQLLLLDALFLFMLLAAAFVLQGDRVQPYIFPAATLSMSLTVLLNGELSVVATAVWAVLAGWYLGGSFEFATYFLVTGLTGALLVRAVRRSSEFFLAGLTAGAIGLGTILAFRLFNQGYDWLGFSTYAASAAVSGGLSAALTLGSLSGLGRLFGVTTAINLLELSHPNHPLLRRLMKEAPGTYHHSMMIGNLAERAAEQVGADPLLVRVAAYFHDIGKLVCPTNFVENQAGIGNIHDHLEPLQSVGLILDHVYGGVRFARQYHLPAVLEDAIWQHHGTNLVSYFYSRAVSMYGEANVNAEDYRYPGPRPQTREMAILMLADGVEAAVRASPGVDGDQLRSIIHRLTQQRMQDGQLDECNLTLRDLAVIEESFATVLQGVSHPRVQYPAPLPAAAGNE